MLLALLLKEPPNHEPAHQGLTLTRMIAQAEPAVPGSPALGGTGLAEPRKLP